MDASLEQRKIDHINLCRDGEVEGSLQEGSFSQVRLQPRALPELDWNDLDIRSSFLGRRFAAPFIITGMTGGVEQGEEINRRLAWAAAQLDIPMGIGSQRIALEHGQHQNVFAVKRHQPKLFLIGNIGIGQLLAADALDQCQRAMDMIDADALAIHVNVLQEVIQQEGDRRFRGVFAKIAQIAETIGRPLIVKEVGAGMDVATARQLFAMGVTAIDVGGRGGTAWGYIEGLRSQDPALQRIAASFRDWGMSTVQCLQSIRPALPTACLVATGGVRSGLDAAKALALGANMVGMGLPLFRAALISEDEVLLRLREYIKGLKVAMICSGAKRPSELTQTLL